MVVGSKILNAANLASAYGDPGPEPRAGSPFGFVDVPFWMHLSDDAYQIPSLFSTPTLKGHELSN
jgi:hypothetical protein